tara:strand:+ start:585 stop:881 length:297 start_codon:yes stop_codon:yes gene_type:complete
MLILFPFASLAQTPVCKDTKALYERLTNTWKEQRVATGTISGNDQAFLEIWQNSKTYSIFVTLAQGTSCSVVLGRNLEWEKLAVEDEDTIRPLEQGRE